MQMFGWLMLVWVALLLPAQTDGTVSVDNDTVTAVKEELAQITAVPNNKGLKKSYKAASCGLCDLKYSPSRACHRVVSYADASTYYSRCILFGWKRCPRKRYSTSYKYQNTCCCGNLVGNQCKVSGCGGCDNKDVRNQPKCEKELKSRYTREYYTVSCGWFGRRCKKSRVKQTYYWYTPPPCCSGFTLVGKRCIKC